jgi:hypothetical protein
LPVSELSKALLACPQDTRMRAVRSVSISRRACPELIASCEPEVPDAGQGNSGFGEGSDLDQVDGVAGAISPVAGGVAVRLGWQSLGVVHADRLGRHPDVPGELPDGDHAAMTALDIVPRPRLQDAVMVNANIDRKTLRDLADHGNETPWTGWPTSPTKTGTLKN